MIFRRAYADEIEKIIILQSNIFHIEQGIPEDVVAEFLSDMEWQRYRAFRTVTRGYSAQYSDP